jgi:hypothetical protein
MSWLSELTMMLLMLTMSSRAEAVQCLCMCSVWLWPVSAETTSAETRPLWSTSGRQGCGST